MGDGEGGPVQETVVVVPAPDGARGLVCGIWRKLDGPGQARGAVPANVYGCLNHLACGTVSLADGTRLPSSFLTGPMTQPLTTSAQAPLVSASVVFEPWLMATWFGVDLAATVDGWVDVGQALAAAPALRHLTPDAAASPEALAQAMQACVALPVPDGGSTLTATLADAGAVGDAARRLGLGERQFERRFKQAFGLTPRRWLTLRAYEGALVRLAGDTSSLAALAAESGFADQAHMSRRFREVAARTPNQVRRALAEKRPGDWPLEPARAVKRR